LSSDTPPGGDEESFTSLVERYLRSNEPSIRKAIIDILVEVIDEPGPDQDRQRVRLLAVQMSLIRLTSHVQRFILEDTALTYVPLVLPSVVDHFEPTLVLLQRIAEVGRPREVCLAFNEALQVLDEVANRPDVSDNGLAFGDDVGDTEELAVQCSVILQCHATGECSLDELLLTILLSYRAVTECQIYADPSGPD